MVLKRILITNLLFVYIVPGNGVSVWLPVLIWVSLCHCAAWVIRWVDARTLRRCCWYRKPRMAWKEKHINFEDKTKPMCYWHRQWKEVIMRAKREKTHLWCDQAKWVITRWYWFWDTANNSIQFFCWILLFWASLKMTISLER